jgi:hypothetical protein
MRRKNKRLATAALGLAAFGAIAASAAGLGGLTSQSVGSSDTVVASCDTDGVGIQYTTSYNATSSKYVVTGVTLTGVDAACSGETAAVTLKGTGGTSLTSGSATVAGTTQAVTLSPTTAGAENVVGASVIISG